MTQATSTTLVPFVFGHGPWLDRWRGAVPAMDDASSAVALDVLDGATTPFFRLMGAANARAFGDLGMPAWVQLDCATLPTAMIGFARPARELDPAIVNDLCLRADIDAVDDHQLVPVAEYTALCTPVAGDVVGFSLFSLVPGLGVRAKALALLVMGAKTQTGITQIDNIALKTHARFGPLEVVRLGVEVHSRPTTTLVYRLSVPDGATLGALSTGKTTRVPFAGATRSVSRSELRAGDRIVDVAAGAFVVVDY
jgi:hypothetical protein